MLQCQSSSTKWVQKKKLDSFSRQCFHDIRCTFLLIYVLVDCWSWSVGGKVIIYYQQNRISCCNLTKCGMKCAAIHHVLNKRNLNSGFSVWMRIKGLQAVQHGSQSLSLCVFVCQCTSLGQCGCDSAATCDERKSLVDSCQWCENAQTWFLCYLHYQLTPST